MGDTAVNTSDRDSRRRVGPTVARTVDAEAEAVTDLRALIRTAEETVSQIQDAIRAYGIVLEMLEDGSSIHDALAAGDVSETRQAAPGRSANGSRSGRH